MDSKGIGIAAFLLMLATAALSVIVSAPKIDTFVGGIGSVYSPDLFLSESPYWIHMNNSAIPKEIWVREDLSTTKYRPYVYYTATAGNRSNGSLVYDFYDDAQTDTSSGYTIVGAGTITWDTTTKSLETTTVAVTGYAPTSQANVSNAKYVVEFDGRYLAYAGGTYNMFGTGLQPTLASVTLGAGGGLQPDGAKDLSIWQLNDNYYNVSKFNVSLDTTYPISVFLDGVNGWAFANATYPANNTVINSTRKLTGAYILTGGYFGYESYGAKTQIDNLRMRIYCPSPTIVYGPVETGTWIFGTTTYTSRRQVNVTAAATYANCTFKLDYTYFNTTNLLITNTSLGNLSIFLGSGISRASFRPLHAYQSDVQPVNQTQYVALFNATPFAAGTYKVNISQTSAISGFTVSCAPNYNKSGIIPINTTTQWISNVTYPASLGIWCWADFNNPSPTSQSYSITVVEG